MTIKASITFMRGPVIPYDVISEQPINLKGIQDIGEAYGFVAGVAGAFKRAIPDGTKQINIVVWNDE